MLVYFSQLPSNCASTNRIQQSRQYFKNCQCLAERIKDKQPFKKTRCRLKISLVLGHYAAYSFIFWKTVVHRRTARSRYFKK